MPAEVPGDPASRSYHRPMSTNAQPHVSSDELTLRMIDEVTRLATEQLLVVRGVDGAEPAPHPLVTDTLYAHHLGELDAAVAAHDAQNRRGTLGRLATAARWVATGRAPWADVQQRIDTSILHIGHQLDHARRSGRSQDAAVERRVVEPSKNDRPTLAIVKPDAGAEGGFERHIERLAYELGDREWSVETVRLDGTTRPRELFGLPVPDVVLHRHDEFFLYMAIVEQVIALDLHRFDVVLTTQPPTFLIDHPRAVALFYHQARQFYDLADHFARSGFVDPIIHQRAVDAVRRMELAVLGDGRASIRRWLAGSIEVRGRLERFWTIPSDETEIHRTAPPGGIADEIAPPRPDGPVVVVGRHEWPKRVELAVAGIHASTTDRRLVAIGDGTRLNHARALDADLGERTSGPARTDDSPDADTLPWMRRVLNDGDGLTADDGTPAPTPSGRIEFVTDADDAARDDWYRSASVVICPAYNEDHGHTAIEAMALGRPVIVCRDGGGLTEFVDDGVTGFVVDPTPEAIGAAIDAVLADPDQAEAMGRAGRRTVESLTWPNAVDHMDRCLRAVFDD